LRESVNELAAFQKIFFQAAWDRMLCFFNMRAGCLFPANFLIFMACSRLNPSSIISAQQQPLYPGQAVILQWLSVHAQGPAAGTMIS
jgi:hypothetical protein